MKNHETLIFAAMHQRDLSGAEACRQAIATASAAALDGGVAVQPSLFEESDEAVFLGSFGDGLANAIHLKPLVAISLLPARGFKATLARPANVGELNQALEARLETLQIAFGAITMVCEGRPLNDGMTLNDKGIEDQGPSARRAGRLTEVAFELARTSGKTMKAAGFSIAQLKAAGFSIAQLKAAGFSAIEFKAAGFSIAQLKAAGFSARDLKANGFSIVELKAIGSASEFKAAGFSFAQLYAAGFSASELKAAGFRSPL